MSSFNTSGNQVDIELQVSPLGRDILASILWPEPKDFQPFQYIKWREYKKWKGVGKRGDVYALPLDGFLDLERHSDTNDEELQAKYEKEHRRRESGKKLGKVQMQTCHLCFGAQGINSNNSFTYNGTIFDQLAGHLSVTAEQIRETVRRELYGILGVTFIVRGATVNEFPSRTNKGLFLPISIQAAVSRCFDDPAEDGVVTLRHAIPKDSLEVLRYVAERQEKLTEKYPGMDPTTSHTTVARELGFSLARTKRDLASLSGILMPCILDKSKRNMQRWQMLYTIPPIRFLLAKGLINELG